MNLCGSLESLFKRIKCLVSFILANFNWDVRSNSRITEMGFLGYLCAGENEISSNRRPYPAFLTQEDIPLKTGMGLN